jgi:hypothetical protein
MERHYRRPNTTSLGINSTIKPPSPEPHNATSDWGTAETLALLQLLAMVFIPALKPETA